MESGGAGRGSREVETHRRPSAAAAAAAGAGGYGCDGAGARRCGGAGGGAGVRRVVARALVRRREPLDPGALARLRRFGEALSRGERPS
ncbi:hypothetical protein SSOG_04737 [Streptomyces himastatinicus ATCC 53653]|uniref:Uncharacterized protein n=1 Tax=Streptomyces himastatinicus ATCC 53653 TaxID=457427 RepID=D9WBR7_9ACTN|nr:hypothetical protein SSOG_04737 [Streptomyces himastatinicus ATCC 53653]